MSSSPTFLDNLIVPLIRGKTVLDVGCGYGRWGCLIRSNFHESGLKEPPVVDGLDAFKPNVDYCSKLGNIYSHVWHEKMPAKLKKKWDTVLACEILEHLNQKDVEKVLTILEHSAKKRIIVTTPNWPDYRPGLNTFLGFNEFEAHRSYISRKFLAKRGYKIRGAGFRPTGNSIIKFIAKIGKTHLFDTTTYYFPVFCHTVIGYKDV